MRMTTVTAVIGYLAVSAFPAHGIEGEPIFPHFECRTVRVIDDIAHQLLGRGEHPSLNLRQTKSYSFARDSQWVIFTNGRERRYAVDAVSQELEFFTQTQKYFLFVDGRRWMVRLKGQAPSRQGELYYMGSFTKALEKKVALVTCH